MIKHILTRLVPAALVLCLTLTACGSKDSGSAGYDPAATAQALLDSGISPEITQKILFENARCFFEKNL